MTGFWNWFKANMEATYVIIGIFIIGCLIVFCLSLELEFLKYNSGKHPKLEAMIERILLEISTSEGIRVFDKSYSEMNVKNDKGNEVVGSYIYTVDADYQQIINRTYTQIVDLEEEYGMPYEMLNKMVGVEITHTKEDYILPRIELAKNELKGFGIDNYYCVWFHELGHHFAVKNLGMKHTEDDADRYASMLVKKHLPLYFQILGTYHYRYARGENKLSRVKYIQASIQYLYYLITKEWLGNS